MVVVIVVAVLSWKPWHLLTPQPAVVPIASRIVESTTAAVPEKSIAVLSFVDMSKKHDQEYFSDGLSEELIEHFSHTADLRVIARTSSFAFKGKNEDIRSIATKLGVANLLEGSVRKEGYDLRITAQLIRASDGTHLWSQTYERKLNDIFKLQDEISTAIEKALNAALSGVGPGRRGVDNAEAYNLLLQANYFSMRLNRQDYEQAIGYAKAALKIQPTLADAWARLSITYSAQAQSGYIPLNAGLEKSRKAALRAIEIDPARPFGHVCLGYVLIDEGDYIGADREAGIAEKMNLGEHFYLLRGNIELSLGRWQAALKNFQEGLRTDPLNYFFATGIADAYWVGGAAAGGGKCLSAHNRLATASGLSPRITGDGTRRAAETVVGAG